MRAVKLFKDKSGEEELFTPFSLISAIMLAVVVGIAGVIFAFSTTDAMTLKLETHNLEEYSYLSRILSSNCIMANDAGVIDYVKFSDESLNSCLKNIKQEAFKLNLKSEDLSKSAKTANWLEYDNFDEIQKIEYLKLKYNDDIRNAELEIEIQR